MFYTAMNSSEMVNIFIYCSYYFYCYCFISKTCTVCMCCVKRGKGVS